MFSLIKASIKASHTQSGPKILRRLSVKTPPRDRGPSKNYQKKVKKAINKDEGTSSVSKVTSSVRKGTAISSSLLDKLQSTEQESLTTKDKPSPVDLSDVLGDIKKYIRSNDDVRRNLGMPQKKFTPPSFEPDASYIKRSTTSKIPMSFTEGKRLGIFNKPSPDTPLMTADKWSFIKEDEAKQVSLLKSLRPYSNVFEKIIEEKSHSTWKYPIDNEAYKTEEEGIGFEEHVFLDKELANGFPKKGPVRHFMELVVSGLSNNHYLSPREKHDHIQWYRDYFAQFPEDELHIALPSDMMNDEQSTKQKNTDH